tara:strand:+ start:712 stop:963 length:252 start_codon:yes stop_codon:yes gene_type:complete
MQLAHEITSSEREAVKRHLTSNEDRMSPKLIDKLMAKYEVTLQNKLNEVTQLKMDLDDRDIAFGLFFEDKLKSRDIKNLIESK